MLSLQDTIRAKLFSQNIHQSPKAYGKLARLQVLDHAWFIIGNYGFQARCSTNLRTIGSRLLKDGNLSMPVRKKNRILTVSTFLTLLKTNRKPGLDDELLSLVKDEGMIDRYDLASKLDIPIKKLDYRLRKEISNWNLIKIDQQIWYWSSFEKMHEQSDKKGTKLESMKKAIVDVMKLYPYLTSEQISFLTGIIPVDLARPLIELTRTNNITRSITRDESPDEIFTIGTPDISSVAWDKIRPFVLEKGDALVEIIKLERFFDCGNGDFWLFVAGLPQAEFNLRRKTKSRIYKIEALQSLSTANLDLSEIQNSIQQWADERGITIEITMQNIPVSKLIMSTIQMLVDRGYAIEDKDLVLRTHKVVKKSQSITWDVLGSWHKKKQEFGSKATTQELLLKFVQFDDIQSIAYRMNIPPSELDLKDIVFIAGIHYRLGFVHKKHIRQIVAGWPRIARPTMLDRDILREVNDPVALNQLVLRLGRASSEILRRLRYLEGVRLIRRKIPGDLDITKCSWISFQSDLPDIGSLITDNRSLASIAELLENILANNIPLTINQLSRFFGITADQIEPIKNELLKNSKIIEGYFLEGEAELQLSLPSILDIIEMKSDILVDNDEEEDEEPASTVFRVDIVPESDPLTIYHLNPLILSDKNLFPSERQSLNSETWMILWDGIPIGYLVKINTRSGMIDYDIDIRIIQQMATIPVLSGVIQKMISLMRSWYNIEGKIRSINNEPISNRKWEPLHFLIQSLGINL
ncbi:MAG: hypothetical protein ACXAD7_18600 [Candidatus Kariarchaeaceae archaeon]